MDGPDFLKNKEPMTLDETGAENNEGGGGKKPRRFKPAIRTMKSDISEYLKGEKPSLISLISKKMEQEPEEIATEYGKTVSSWRVVVLWIITVAAVLVTGVLAIRWFLSGMGQTVSNPELRDTTPSYFTTEYTKPMVSQNKGEFLSKTKAVADAGGRSGSFQKIDAKFSDGKTVRPMIFKDFLRFLGAAPPSDLEISAFPEFEPFIYYSDSRPIFGIALRVVDAQKAVVSMKLWESAMPRELYSFFLDTKTDMVIIYFEERIYNNVTYHFARMSSTDADVGLAYFIFPSKNYLVITASEEAAKVVINRMFER